MGAVRMCARSIARRKIVGSAALALLVGLAGGAVLAAFAGARRTESAYGRLLETTRAADVQVLPQGFGRVPAAKLADLPQVAELGRFLAFGMSSRPKGDGFPNDLGETFPVADPDGVEFYDLDRLDMLEGRLPRRDRVREAVVNEIFARHTGLGVGDIYRAYVFSFDEVNALTERIDAEGRQPTPAEIRSVFAPVDLAIVGIGRPRSDLLVNENQDESGMFLTPAFARRYASKASAEGVAVKLRDPAHDLAPFEAAVRARLPNVNLDFEPKVADAATFAQVMSPYVDALKLFALVAALTGLLVVAQACVRVVVADSTDAVALRALGVTRLQRATLAGARAVTIALAGALVAGAIAFFASPLFPLGRARLAEPTPGFRFDPVVLVFGAIAVFAVLLLTVGFVAWRVAREPQAAGGELEWRPSRVVERIAHAGATPSFVSGVRFAVQRDRGDVGASLVSALFGLVAAITAIGASLVFATNLTSLVNEPTHYGWSWDALLDTYDVTASPDLLAAVRADGDLAGVTTGARASLLVDGRTVPAFGLRRVRGDVFPAATAGRTPRTSEEIALGAQTLRDIGKSLGDTVTVQSSQGAQERFRVVGRTALPSLSLNGSYGLGEGAALTARGMRRVDSAAAPSFVLLDLAPGVRLSTINHRYRDTASALGPQRPADIQSYDAVRATPLVLAALLATLGVGVLAHLLLTSVRRRRRDLAILKTIGFRRRQVALTVAWQATTLVGIALLVGIPLGLVAGRWVWHGFADDLGVTDAVVVPVIAMVAIATSAVVLANLIASLPARVAARTQPAAVLRSE